MSDIDKKPEAFSTSLYVTDKAAYEECKRLLKLQDRSLSEEIMEFVIRRRDELKGNGSTESGIDSTKRLEVLKAEHFKVLQKIDKLKAVLDEKRVLGDYRDKFGKILGYDPTGGSRDGRECSRVIEEFLKHSNDAAWKRAVTQFLVFDRSGGLVHTFLDLLGSHRERFRLDRELLEMQTDPEELAWLDEVERQAKEQRKKEAELRKQEEAEEERQQKVDVASEGLCEEDDEDDLEEEAVEEDSEEEEFIDEPSPITAIVPVNEHREEE